MYVFIFMIITNIRWHSSLQLNKNTSAIRGKITANSLTGVKWILLCDNRLKSVMVKDAMPVSFRSILFTSHILLPYLSIETYSRKYEKLPNIVIHACKNNTEKMFLLKMSGPQIWLCLFTFRPIASKKLNGLTTIDTLS